MCEECRLRKELKKAGIPDLVNVQDLSEHFGISPRRIQQLANDGVIPKSIKGQYNLIVCIQRYISYLKDQVIAQRVEHRYER